MNPLVRPKGGNPSILTGNKMSWPTLVRCGGDIFNVQHSPEGGKIVAGHDFGLGETPKVTGQRNTRATESSGLSDRPLWLVIFDGHTGMHPPR